MKRLLIILIGVCAVLTSCDLHTSDGGDLDGFWQATFRENLLTGEVVDMRDYYAAWGFNGGLVQMNSSLPDLNNLIGKYTRTDNHLHIDHLYRFVHGVGDMEIEDVSSLDFFGFNQLEETFEILELNKNTLRLKNERVVLNFRRY
ncbi:MAG: lipocalin-like domain-containing protein [Prevotella sp.]|nr:lipocalin-like domain-containing protein [Prevotella sp.]MBQ9187041.1 lipocalin-like domain-containing protein [Prevotella sp.]